MAPFSEPSQKSRFSKKSRNAHHYTIGGLQIKVGLVLSEPMQRTIRIIDRVYHNAKVKCLVRAGREAVSLGGVDVCVYVVLNLEIRGSIHSKLPVL